MGKANTKAEGDLGEEYNDAKDPWGSCGETLFYVYLQTHTHTHKWHHVTQSDNILSKSHKHSDKRKP